MITLRIDFAFGDCMFTLPLLRLLHRRHRQLVGVAVPERYRDAYANFPWLYYIDSPEEASAAPDFTPGHHFDRMKRKYGQELSLLDVPWLRAQELGWIDNLPEADHRRPLFAPTRQEQQRARQLAERLSDRPLVAVESAYFSQQSWCDQAARQQLVDHYGRSHHILWLSPQDYPEHPAVQRMEGFSRRECIAAIAHCQEFVTTGSGLFCASLALDWPGRTLCMWHDEYYRYRLRMAQLRWRPITWVGNHQELQQQLGKPAR